MPKKRTVAIEGVEYASISEAARALNMPLPNLYNRVISQNRRWKRYHYTDGKPVPIFSKKNQRRNSVLWVTYVFEHLKSGKKYTGITGHFPSRKATHLHQLRYGRHRSYLLQDLYDSDNDLANWKWTIYIVPTKEHALDHEQAFMDQFDKEGLLLNNSKNARSTISYVMLRPEVAERLRERRACMPAISRMRRAQGALRGTVNRWSKEGAREKIQGSGNPFAKRVVAAGVEYGSVIEATKALGVVQKTVFNRVRSARFPDYYFP